MHYFLLELYFAHSYLHSFPTRRSSDLYFGPTYDVHGGGSDLIFPHHEAEIAQAEGLTGREPLARYWLHTGLLSVKGEEMHKSLGNFITIQDMIRKVGAPGLRVFYAGTHYISPLDFTDAC